MRFAIRLFYTLLILLFVGYVRSQGTIFNEAAFSKHPVIFVENGGQVRDQHQNMRNDIIYVGHTGNLSYYIRKNGISYQFSKVQSWSTIDGEDPKKNRKIPDTTIVYRLDVNLINTNREIYWKGEGLLSGYENFYTARCPTGILKVKSFKSVLLKNIYDKIDIRYYSAEGSLKYDYILKPFANYKEIKTLISGATAMKVQADGSVLISSPLGQIVEAAPRVYQNNRELTSRWQLSGDTLSFHITGYDPSQTMIIDPIVRDWSTYYGDSGDDIPGSLKTDQFGNLYLCGSTNSSLSIATVGAYQTIFAGGINSTGDAYLVKFNNAGVRQWATYYGGDGTDNGNACAIDGTGNVYLTGTTNTGGWWSPGSASVIAAPSSFISTYTTGTNGFLAKFNSNGFRQWGTYLYGDPVACTTDQNGDVYIGGNFPVNFSGGTTAIIATPGSHQITSGGNGDAFIIKFNGSGVRIWGTYYGGPGGESLTSMALDINNNVYIAGHSSTTQGTAVATPGSHQFTYGGYQDGFLAKFNSAGVRLWSTYYGGPDYEYGWACCTDPIGNVYLAGTQVNYYIPYSGTLIATPNSYQSTIGSGFSDAFLVKFNSLGIRQWATYYGGTSLDEGHGCSSDSYGNVYLSGTTTSSNAIASGSAFQTNFGGGIYDAFLAKFDNNGFRQWGTYYGDLGIDFGTICLSDIYNNSYLCGRTTSTANISALGSHQTNFGGGTFDTYLVKFSECYMPSTPVNITPAINMTICTGNATTLIAQSSGNIEWYSSPTGTSVIGLGASYITPTLSAGIYTFYAGANLCGDSINPTRAAVVVTVSSNTPPSISANTGTICGGQTFTIQPSGAFTYTISGGSFIVNPYYTTSYLISGTSSLGCIGMSYMTLTVAPSPTVTGNSGYLCTGKVYTINPSGAFTYTITGNTFTVVPNVNTSYSITGISSAGCVANNTAVVNVTVIPSPTITVTPSGSICAGNIFQINASSGPVQGWGGWSITGGNYNVSPSVTTSYTVTGWAINGCSASSVVTVSVYPVPILTVSNGFTCLGDSYTISPAGASTYSITGNTFIVSPSQNTNYTITGASQYGCVSPPAVCTVSVWTRPTISVNSGTICSGQSFTIAPVGGVNYTISGGSTIVTPLNTATYSVIGTNTSAAVGCQVSYPVISTVLVNPTPTVIANSGTICAGKSFTIFPSGAATYTYSSGSAIMTPVSNSTYSVIGTNSFGCVSPAPAISQVSVLPLPPLQVVSSNTSICTGDIATLTASGAGSYIMHGYSFNPTIAITPSTTTQFTVVGIGSNGCLKSFVITQFVELCTITTENLEKGLRLNIYPNPNKGQFYVESAIEVDIELFSLLGQVLKREHLLPGINLFSLDNCAPGVYFIRPAGLQSGPPTKVVKQ